MDPVTASIIGRGAVGVGQMLGGLLGKKQSRPKMNVPQSVQEATQRARQQANATVRPGNENALRDIRKTTANTVASAKSVSSSANDVLAAASRAGNAEQSSINRNNAQNAAYSFQSNNQLINQLGRQGAYEQRAFEVNKMQPYMQEQQARAGLIGAGMQSINNAGSDYASYDILKNAMGLGGKSSNMLKVISDTIGRNF